MRLLDEDASLSGLLAETQALVNGSLSRQIRRMRSVERSDIPAALDEFLGDGVGVEIGVKRGEFSEVLLKDWTRCRSLVSVDPWLHDGTGSYRDVANVSQDDHEAFYSETVDRLSVFGSRSEVWRMTSLKAAERFSDGEVAFVYLDARHDYANVASDLQAWWPCIRSGGVLAGHDFIDGEFAQGVFALRQPSVSMRRPTTAKCWLRLSPSGLVG